MLASAATADALSVYTPLPDAVVRLVCFPHAGGAASAFRKLKHALAPLRIEVCALQPPGRENRLQTRCAESATALAIEFGAAIDTLRRMPTVYLGHSMGGLIAFLTAHIRKPEKLIASAALSPISMQSRRSTHTLPSVEFKQRLFAMGGVPKAIQEQNELFEMFEPAIRADYRILDNYLYRESAPLHCPVSVYLGEDDATITHSDAIRWQSVTTEPLLIRQFCGGHFFLYQHTHALIAALREDIIQS